MRPCLFLSTAIIALSASLPAAAQYYGSTNAKGGDNIMSDARRMDPDTTAPARQTSQAEPQQERVPRIEPAAGSDTNSYDDFTGFYGGGDLGYAFTDDVEGWNGGLFAGYGFERDFDLFGAYAGIELGYEWSGADGSSSGLSYEKEHAWLATFRPGVTIMEDGLGYGIIGYSRAEFEGGGADEHLDGLVLGLGGQLNTGMAFKPRLEYTHTNYEDGNLGGTNFSTTENVVKLGAVFQF